MKIKVLRPSAVGSNNFSVGEYDIDAFVAQSLLNAGVAVSLTPKEVAKFEKVEEKKPVENKPSFKDLIEKSKTVKK